MANTAKKKTTFTKETYLNWYETMLRIRRFEERALMAYSQRKIRGFCHVYIGQEAVAAGLSSASRQNDPWITAYRQHGLAIAKGIDTRSAMAELFGKVTDPDAALTCNLISIPGFNYNLPNRPSIITWFTFIYLLLPMLEK